MILQKYFEVLISGRNYNYYKNKGYDVKKGEICLVENKDYPNKREDIEKRKCDKCGRIVERKRSLHTGTFKIHGQDLCVECSKIERIKKAKQTNLIKYGTEFPIQSDIIKEKAKKTTLQNYGVEFSFQNKEVQEKAHASFKEKIKSEDFLENLNKKRKQTNIEKYGVENPFQSDLIKEKTKQTLLEKYGVEYITQSFIVKEKIEKTNLEKYGVKYPLQNQEIMQKFINTITKNYNIPTSKPQIEVYKLCQSNYPNWEINLNYPLSTLCLDVSIKTSENILIDIEYDGWVWHHDKKKKDYARDVIVKNYGYKILRIKSGEMVPTFEQLDQKIQDLILTPKSFQEIVLPDWEKEENNINIKKQKQE